MNKEKRQMNKNNNKNKSNKRARDNKVVRRRSDQQKRIGEAMDERLSLLAEADCPIEYLHVHGEGLINTVTGEPVSPETVAWLNSVMSQAKVKESDHHRAARTLEAFMSQWVHTGQSASADTFALLTRNNGIQRVGDLVLTETGVTVITRSEGHGNAVRHGTTALLSELFQYLGAGLPGAKARAFKRTAQRAWLAEREFILSRLTFEEVSKDCESAKRKALEALKAVLAGNHETQEEEEVFRTHRALRACDTVSELWKLLPMSAAASSPDRMDHWAYLSQTPDGTEVARKKLTGDGLEVSYMHERQLPYEQIRPPHWGWEVIRRARINLSGPRRFECRWSGPTGWSVLRVQQDGDGNTVARTWQLTDADEIATLERSIDDATKMPPINSQRHMWPDDTGVFGIADEFLRWAEASRHVDVLIEDGKLVTRFELDGVFLHLEDKDCPLLELEATADEVSG